MVMSPNFYALPISPGQKWWQTVLENRNLMQPMGRLNMHSLWALFFFPFGGGIRWGSYSLFSFFCVPNLFPTCSIDIPQVPMLFYKAFPIAPQSHLIWFAQTSTLWWCDEFLVFLPLAFLQSSTLMHITWKG